LEDVTGANVLDLYAGSGSLGIEALSRGATHAVFVERARAAGLVLRRNLATLELTPCATVVMTSVERATRPVLEAGPYHLVLVDPPYADVAGGLLQRSLPALLPAVAESAAIVIEHASRDNAPEFGELEHQRTRRYGDTSLSFYQLTAAQRPRQDAGS